MCVCVCMRVCVHVCACTRARVCVCARARVRTAQAPSEILAIIAIRNAHRIITRTMNIARAGLAAVRAFMAKHPSKFTMAEPR